MSDRCGRRGRSLARARHVGDVVEVGRLEGREGRLGGPEPGGQPGHGSGWLPCRLWGRRERVGGVGAVAPGGRRVRTGRPAWRRFVRACPWAAISIIRRKPSADCQATFSRFTVPLPALGAVEALEPVVGSSVVPAADHADVLGLVGGPVGGPHPLVAGSHPGDLGVHLRPGAVGCRLRHRRDVPSPIPEIAGAYRLSRGGKTPLEGLHLEPGRRPLGGRLGVEADRRPGVSRRGEPASCGDAGGDTVRVGCHGVYGGGTAGWGG